MSMVIIDRAGTRRRRVCLKCRKIHSREKCPVFKQEQARVVGGLTNAEWLALGRETTKAFRADIAAFEERLRRNG